MVWGLAVCSSPWKMKRDPGQVSRESPAWPGVSSGMDSPAMQEKGLFLERTIQSAFQQHLTPFPPP